MSETDQCDNRSGFHEIKMAAITAQESPGAVPKSCAGTQRNQRVHIRAAAFELAPGAAIETRSCENLNDGCDGERGPLKPGHGRQTKNPFTQHQWNSAKYADPKI